MRKTSRPTRQLAFSSVMLNCVSLVLFLPAARRAGAEWWIQSLPVVTMLVAVALLALDTLRQGRQ